jgi:small subunit ribosomal protein S2
MAYRIDPRDLLKTGAHFGHNTSRWNPKMAEYIFDKKDGVHIIDLVKTAELLEVAQAAIEKIASTGKQVLFVSTKPQARAIIEKVTTDTSSPYVINRWPGGLMTNWQTMSKRIAYMKNLQTKMDSGELAAKYNKLEVQRYQEEIDEMMVLYGGVANMDGAPSAVIVADIQVDNIAVAEARKLGIPVFAIVDTNSNPINIDYPIPANDDAIKAVSFIIEKLAEAIAIGQGKVKKEMPKAEANAEAKVETVKEEK